MKTTLLKLILFSFSIIALSTASIAQPDSHRMSEPEKAAMPEYLRAITPSDAAGFTTPPSSPVRASAEWEEIDALTITWTDFPAILKDVVRYSQTETQVLIVCSDSNTVKTYLTNNSVPLTNLHYIIAPFDRIWARDYGPWNIYTNDVDSLALIDWIYNRPRPHDDTVPSALARYTGLPMYQTISAPNDLIHTGGNFMTDGFGTGFSSNLILDENPSKTEAQIDTIMKHFMGIDRYIKMTTLPYDEIHHIDMHLKLLDEETLMVGEYPAGVADGPQIEANLQYILSNYNSIYGTPYKVVRIPMPPDGSGLYPNLNGDYRTYTNAVFVNKTIILPTYAQQYDTTAIRIWKEALPGYSIKTINCNSIIPSLGAIHCITKEIAASDPLLISHQPLHDTYNTSSSYQVDARIQHRSGINTAEIFYRTDTTQPYLSVAMSLTGAATNTWTGYIPAQSSGSTVYYYIEASSVSGKIQVRPLPAPVAYWKFHVLLNVGLEEPIAPAQLNLMNAFPNPSKGITCIPVSCSTAQHATLILKDLLGKTVKAIFDGNLVAGEKNYFVNTSDIASGVYIIVLKTDRYQLMQKLIVR
jgi:agmatine deiminase